MNKDILVCNPVKRSGEEDSLLEQIEKKLAELDKKKKSEMEKGDLEKERDTIENHIRTALQMQMITQGLADYYREKLEKASRDRKEKNEKELFSMKDLPGMIETRRQKKIRDEVEGIRRKIEKNPNYQPTVQENRTLSNWEKVKASLYHPTKEK